MANKKKSRATRPEKVSVEAPETVSFPELSNQILRALKEKVEELSSEHGSAEVERSFYISLVYALSRLSISMDRRGQVVADITDLMDILRSEEDAPAPPATEPASTETA